MTNILTLLHMNGAFVRKIIFNINSSCINVFIAGGINKKFVNGGR